MTKEPMVKHYVHDRWFDPEGPVEEIIEELSRALRSVEEGNKLVLEYVEDPYEDHSDLCLVEYRPENEEDKAKRLEREEEVRKANESWKRKQLEQLKKELGED